MSIRSYSGSYSVQVRENTDQNNSDISRSVHQRYHPKVIGHILKNKQKDKCVCIHEIIRLIIMKMKMKMENRSHIYDMNRPKPRYSKYRKCLNMSQRLKLNS